MTRKRSPGMALALGLLAVEAAMGCNAVLGIEPAELGETTEQLSCAWPSAEPKADCPTCDEGCGCNPGECLADQDCREALLHYRKCVGAPACSDTSGQCQGCMNGNEKAKALVACLDRCNCTPAGAATLCQSYCACMQDRCSENAPAGQLGCMESCLRGQPGQSLGFNGVFESKPPDWEVYCFWKHCEMASERNDKFHCKHAAGDNVAATCPEPTNKPTTVLCEYPKGYGNAPCNGPEDCCGTCRDVGVCTAP